jgi:DNA repair protein RadC
MKAILPEFKLVYKTNEEIVKEKINSPQTCAEVLKRMFDKDTIEYSEEAILLILNRANETIGWYKISAGGTAAVIMDVKKIFAVALKAGGHSIILAHNHPSGNLTPSNEDIEFTKKVKQAGEILDIQLLDHLIITKNDYCSIFANGYI